MACLCLKQACAKGAPGWGKRKDGAHNILIGKPILAAVSLSVSVIHSQLQQWAFY